MTDSALVASVSIGLVRSVDEGQAWSTIYPVGAIELASVGSAVLAANYNGLFYSWDNGLHWLWTLPESGLPPARQVSQLAVDGNTVYAIGAFDGIYRSNDAGSHWTLASAGLPVTHVYSVAADGGVVLTALGQELYRSTDQGQSWTDVGPGPVSAFGPGPVSAYGGLVAGGGRFYAARLFGVSVSNDGGLTWSPAAGLPPNTFVNRAVARGPDLFLFTTYDVYRTSDGGASWSKLSVGAPDKTPVFDMVERDGALFAATLNFGIQRSDDGGVTWKRVSPTGGGPPPVITPAL